MSIKSIVSSIVTRLKNEPVAVWGVVLAAVIGVLPFFGVPAATIAVVGSVLSILGIPVVRGKVTPLQALEALIAGLEAEGKLNSATVKDRLNG